MSTTTFESFTLDDWQALVTVLDDVRAAGYPCPWAEELMRLDRPLQARAEIRAHRERVLETIRAETRPPQPTAAPLSA